MTGNSIIVGLDVGTTKICAMAAESNKRGARIIGRGVSSSTGLRKGIVINMDATVDSIKKAVSEAESASGIKIKSVSVGISGGHVAGLHSSGAVGVRKNEVSASDIERAIESAKAVYIPLDREVLHVIPTGFILDGQEGIANPAGMSGVRLEANVHIITAAVSPLQNLLKCCEKAGLDVVDVVFGPLASARATLTAEEREFGVVLVDIGGGTTDIAVFKDGSLQDASVLGIGGCHLTNDIAVGLRIYMAEAETLKKESGAAFASIIGGSEEMKILQSGREPRTLPRKYIAEILQPRCEETLGLIKREIEKSHGYETAVSGVVFTGGGTLLEGFDKLAETTLGLPVRIGRPINVRGFAETVEGPSYAAAAGLAVGEEDPVESGPSRPRVLGKFVGQVTDLAKDISRYAEHLYNFKNFNRKEGGNVCLKSRR